MSTAVAMEEIVEALVLSPFREIVAKAKAARANADAAGKVPEATEPSRAARSLEREGERAVEKIEPLCKKLLETCGHNFIDALKDNDDIAQYRTQINDLLWEFDDYLELEDFDKAKFSELQALSRSCAPKIVDILIRMKLEPVWREPSGQVHTGEGSFSTGRSAQGEGSREPNVFTHGGVHLVTAANNDPAMGPLVLQTDNPVDLTEPGAGNMIAQSGPDLGLDGVLPGGGPVDSGEQGAVTQDSISSDVLALVAEPPPFPEKSPWRLGIKLQADLAAGFHETDRQVQMERRPCVPTPPPSNKAPSEVSGLSSPRFPDAPGGIHMATEPGQNPEWALPSPVSPLQLARDSPATRRSFPDMSNGPNPAGKYTMFSDGSVRHTANYPQLGKRPSLAMGGETNAPMPHSRDSSVSDARYSSLFDARADGGCEIASPVTTSHRVSGMSAPDTSPFPDIPEEEIHPALRTTAQRSPTRLQSADMVDQPGLEPAAVTPEVDSGLIPVNADGSEYSPAFVLPPRRVPDCSIGPDSSFHQLKGFCEGAKEVLRGAVGVKQVRKLSYGPGAVMAARCRNCFFELNWADVEADINGEASANYVSKSTGLGFRLRFLSKSHITARTIEDQLYGCLFCIQQGRTTEESDATVFFSQKQLFAHIARHPRPLPIVPGLNVIEDAGDSSPGGTTQMVPVLFRNGYDLHLPQPPKPSQTGAEAAHELEMLPTARAMETVRQAAGTMKVPPDRSTPLQFAVGARIVGVEFPARFGGEWAVGWSDNAKGMLQASSIRLEPPPRDQIVTQGGSNMRAVVRWKFSVKDKERGDWLKLEKGETIYNIGWTHMDHWCWSGVNSKGKWGIFPRSHMDASTLREGTPTGDRASVTSHEGNKMSSILSRMSIRARAGSSASSGSSSQKSGRRVIY